MALTKQTLTLISISILLFCTIYARETSSPAASPGTLSNLYNLLPSIGLQKVMIASPSEEINVATKQLQVIEQKTNELVKTMRTRLADLAAPKEPRKCLMQCADNLVSAIDDIKLSITSINDETFWKAKINVNAASEDVGRCRDCFAASHTEYPEFKTFDAWYKGVSAECVKNLEHVKR
ncbi:hypothetical protein OSB04_015249 [Centaurea solstitialis]|uniref:Pectinesterase inhibitor domain-containing protein n=1 Tax=Centaurea solstitialis TaxID=347529 RepID=A0AA38SYM9_9ASTR|nr:hypothetical protein OSB04_015249 [Centaurea solstitialis]